MIPTLISDEKLDELLANSPAERVTKESIDSRIKEVGYTRLSETVTICSINLDNGYSVRGESACVNPENYNEEIGQRVAFDNAYAKLWGLFGFLLAESTYRHGKKAGSEATQEAFAEAGAVAGGDTPTTDAVAAA